MTAIGQDTDKFPREMRALVLDGIGFGHLAIRKVPVPAPGAHQLLARVEAAGICTSLIKLIEQGPDHKLMYGWNPAEFPIILGDEGVVTVVQVGEALRDRYRIGERFVVQPAVDHPPVNHRERYRDGGQGVNKVAVGYTLAGHLAEYILVPEEVLNAGCLLPTPNDRIPLAHAAMSEPLSCVVSAQEHHLHIEQDTPQSTRRAVKGLKRGGVTVVIGAGAMGRMHVDLAFAHGPRAIVVADFVEERQERVRKLFGERSRKAEVALHTVDAASTPVEYVVNQLTNYAGADDVIVAVGSRKAIEDAQKYVGRGAVLNLFGGLKKGDEIVGLDAGAVHYKEINVTGSSGGSPWDIARTLELIAAEDLDVGAHITRVGDLEHAIEFLGMVKAQQIDGKAVVYPHRRTEKILSVDSWSAGDERAYLQTSEI
ncbi:MAG: zinc-binding dehydrogenase [Terracidiphilus sp.]|jgi:threonine dehydrogenase-like Zn-dependent dehydrogenase